MSSPATVPNPIYPKTVRRSGDLRRGDILYPEAINANEVGDRVIVLDIYDECTFHGMEESGVIMQYSIGEDAPAKVIGFADIDDTYSRLLLRLTQHDAR